MVYIETDSKCNGHDCETLPEWPEPGRATASRVKVRGRPRSGASSRPRCPRGADVRECRRVVRGARSLRSGTIHGRWASSTARTRADDLFAMTYLLDTNACIAL